MPPTDENFTAFIVGLGAGNDEGIRQLFCRFASRLIALARAELDSRIRQKVDPEDVLQSVYKSFFRRHADGEFDLDGWDRLWALLATITINKCRRWNRHFRTARRDVGHEIPIHPQIDHPGSGPLMLADDPTAEEVVLVTELVETLLRELSPENRPILSLALEGCSVAEIGEQAGRSERSVYRVLNKVKLTLERLAGQKIGNP